LHSHRLAVNQLIFDHGYAPAMQRVSVFDNAHTLLLLMIRPNISDEEIFAVTNTKHIL
jgi:hypothetical protein